MLKINQISSKNHSLTKQMKKKNCSMMKKTRATKTMKKKKKKDIENAVIENMIVKIIKNNFYKLTRIEQKKFSQKKMNIRLFFKLDFDKTYTLKNLNDSKIFDRKFRLLFHARFEQVKQHMRISFHVKYDKLLKEIAKQIALKMIIEKQKIKKFKTLLELIRR